MPEKATRRSVKKSRGGCARCKSQHLKCDEQRPACGRCERLDLQCPGYSQPIKWSRKHERSQSAFRAEEQSSASQTPFVVEESLTPLPAIHDLDWLDFNMPLNDSDLTNMVEATAQEHETTSTAARLTQRFSKPAWLPADSLFGRLDSTENMKVATAKRVPVKSQSMLRSLGARMANNLPRVQQSLLHEPYELMSYYFKTIPALYSTFDSHKNPFRSSVSNLFSHSLAVNLAAQSMAAACLVETHPRFIAIGSKLRREALEAVQNEPNHNYDVLLALIMSGPTGNWFQPNDLGVASYHEMRDRLDVLALSNAPDERVSFFQEAMVLWELFLAYANPSVLRPGIQLSPKTRSPISNKFEAHSWTGVAHDTLQIIRDIGRLVRGNRLRSLNQKFISQAHIHQLSADLAMAQDLEQNLLATVHPAENDIAPTDDEATPIWHITTIAEVFRYAGLLQLYRVFPDLLSNRMRSEQGFAADTMAEFGTPFEVSDQARNQWLTAFAMEGLRLLESIEFSSGTKDFQAFLLVTLASELVCRDDYTVGSDDLVFTNDLADSTVSKPFAEVAMMRKFVLDRLTAFLRVIPPKPIRICLDIVKETWRRIDEGQENVYWLDVMIDNGWETIMA